MKVSSLVSSLPHFQSFMAAGFECTYALTQNHQRLDLLAATRHDTLVKEDYRLIKSVGITTVREGLAWHQIDRGHGAYDFSRFEPIRAAGHQFGIQQIWDLNHFDYPTALDPFSEAFVDRFATYAGAVVRWLRQSQTGTLYIVPINEISFFAWIGADQGWWAPYATGSAQGFAFKLQLVKAALAAMKLMKELDSNLRFIQADPFMRRVATVPVSPTAQHHVAEFNQVVRYEAWDLLAGRIHPEVGGDPQYLDIIGVNYYLHNQEWVHTVGSHDQHLSHQRMDWESPDRISFAEMLVEIYQRYHRPLWISETGSFGTHRRAWWTRTLAEIDEAMQRGVPIVGVCAYPVLDRPESTGFLEPNSGLWDFQIDDVTCARVPHGESLAVVERYNRRWSHLDSEPLATHEHS